MQFTKEQLAHKFAASVLESMATMATSIRSLLETGKDLNGVTHILSPDELRTGFTDDQMTEINHFIEIFASPLPQPEKVIKPSRKKAG